MKAASKAIELMTAHRDKPFFLAVGLVRPHVPLVAPAAWHDRYPVATMNLPPQVVDDEADMPKYARMKTSASTGLDCAEKAEVLSAYYASVAFMDAQVGRLLDALDDWVCATTPSWSLRAITATTWASTSNGRR